MQTDSGDSPPRAVLIAAVVVAVGALVGVLAFAVLRQPGPSAVPLTAVPAPQAESAECDALVAALPEDVGDATRVPILDPAPPGTAAWRADDGGEPIVLRCGLDRPAEFVVGAALQSVDRVQWFRIAEPGGSRSTWYAVDRPVYVALTLPPNSGPTPIQKVSAAIEEVLPGEPIDPAPVG
ncbi:DUF3515 domain-containing protein [Mycobacterium sp. IDR2000157661]|uniref:DUF3515 domain-containing protein n=1 Tax=Mycobacterium sp. IDR2000157661 TaxID=2867005 RepID=UPI001EE9F9DF|nr:DUF3515 domain-containing protein [Mycobacterium sp. IDR2000157661]ULE33175.1 DUF3515 domain-containing protein [Mycobacterium sp. IDR2000157661]